MNMLDSVMQRESGFDLGFCDRLDLMKFLKSRPQNLF